MIDLIYFLFAFVIFCDKNTFGWIYLKIDFCDVWLEKLQKISNWKRIVGKVIVFRGNR